MRQYESVNGKSDSQKRKWEKVFEETLWSRPPNISTTWSDSCHYDKSDRANKVDCTNKVMFISKRIVYSSGFMRVILISKKSWEYVRIGLRNTVNEISKTWPDFSDSPWSDSCHYAKSGCANKGDCTKKVKITSKKKSEHVSEQKNWQN